MAVNQDVRHKVVVRKLPPGISQEEVRAAIDAVCQGRYDWFSFVPGKVSLKRVKHSRTYLNFLDAAEVLKFRAQFGGHAFVNKKGAQYKCTVEYAPYQKVPREKIKEDPREGTCENDADFVAFKQQMEGDPELLPSAEVQLELKEQEKKAVAEASSKPKVTPLMQFLHDKHSLKPEKKAPIMVPVKKKSNKTNADLDLPPHLANKPATSSQATLSKPSTSHQPSMSRPSSKANVVPIPISDQTQPSSSSKSKKPYDQSAGKGEARPDDGEPSASSRNTTPSRKGKQQRSQEGQSKVPNAKPDTFASPAVVRKVVPIKLDRTPRPADSQAGPSHGATGSGQSSSQAQQPETRNGAQDGDKPGRKVRPGFQTWAPRGRGRGEDGDGDEAGPPGVHALTAAKAAASAALRAESRAAGRQPQPEASQSQIDPAPSSRVPSQGGWGSDATSQPAKNGWDDQPPPYTTATPTRGRGKGRGSSSRGRAGPAVQPPAMQRDAEPASDGWGAEASATEAGQGHDGWGDAVAADFPGAQAVPAVRQNDPRPRGRGRGRGRGGGRGADRQYEQMQPSGDTMVPPGNFGAPSGQAPAMPPKIVIIKKRPQPATAAPE